MMKNRPDEIVFTSEDGDDVVFTVIEQTRLGGIDYLLVSTVSDVDGEEEALILKDISKDTDPEAVYKIVEDEEELDLVAGIFEELIGDIEII